MFERLVGQERAVGVLARAVERPVHAYLLVGAAGSGVDEAARDFAAALAGLSDDVRALDLVRRRLHPDVVEFEPEGALFLTRQAGEVLDEAARSPVEAERKVLVVRDADRMNAESANRLLKTLEEPPARVQFVLTTSRPDTVLVTIRSRCQRVDLDPVDDATLATALVAEGCEPELAARGARLAGGQLARARALVGSSAAVRAAFARAADEVDGTGATADRLAHELDVELDVAVAGLDARHKAEAEAFESEMERHGYDARASQRMRRRLLERQKREQTRARRDLLLEGITALETRYRDALVAPTGALADDFPALALAPRSCAAALDACREAREAVAINEKGILRLQFLLFSLPPAGRVATAGR